MQKKYNRNIERFLLLLVTVILLVMAVRYYFNIKDDLAQTDANYEAGTAMNLQAPLNENLLRKILLKGDYFVDAGYTNFIVKELKQKVDKAGSLPNLGAINKKNFFADAAAFNESKTDEGRLRFLNNLAQLGMDSALYSNELNNPEKYPDVTEVQPGKKGITISGIVDFKNTAVARAGVLIKLTQVYASIYLDTLDEDKEVQTEFYARTNKDGHYAFTNVPENGNYSVTAIKPGFEFGGVKGEAAIGGNKKFNFTGNPSRMRLLDATEYRQIKSDKIFTVRTPEVFLNTFIRSLLLFAAAFWLLHFCLSIKKYRSDQFILPLLMFITGTGITVLYSVQDPLRDEIYGTGMALCSAAVLGLFAVLSFLFKNNPVNRFYHSRWFDPVHHFLPGANKLKAPRGYTWLILSIILMLALVFAGTGPEGSGVKVNLFGFQVSELSKTLMIVFFAAFFAVNADYFRNIPDNRWLIRNNLLMFALFVFLLLIYAVLGDLGPAVVLCLTFLFFYAFAKEEFFGMVLAAVLYGVLLLITARFTKGENTNWLAIVAAVCCAGTFVYALIKKKHESVFFMVLIISSFILLAALPFDFTQRLADRNGMFRNIWENKLVGGDQVAHGVWSLNAGGISGQGLGKGDSRVMPAHHTDMIMQSIGEELGIVAMIALFLAFGLLVYRCVLVARRTGKTFMFYLIAGIAIATMLQLMLIVSGTLGLVPLTGISVPFLSKGNAGIIVTLIAFCAVLLMSNEKGDKLEMEYMKEHFDNVNAYAVLSFFAILLVFIGTLIWYQAKSNTYITKPALVLNRQGEWQYTYNPRIALLMRKIQPGNIYDRNGTLLATSSRNTLQNAKDKLLAAGGESGVFNDNSPAGMGRRYYTFGQDMLFWLGDYKREIARAENNGYAAEYRYFTLLRGFDVTNTAMQKTTDRYKENRFLPQTERETELVLYDYSALAPLLKQGKDNALLLAQDNKKKDIQLSVDATLSKKISGFIQGNPKYKGFRTSIVAVNAKTGEVLVSASNPAPSYKDMKLIGNIEGSAYQDIYTQLFRDKLVVPQDMGITYNSRPGSTVKIIDAFAAMNQYGMQAANFSFFIEPGEVIRPGEPVNENVDMRQAIVRSSNVYFIKLANEKNLQQSLFNMYDALGMNIINRGGYHFYRPEDYTKEKYFSIWDAFVAKGKNIYNSQRLAGSKKRFHSNYSNIAWGQGELGATPFHLAKMSGAIANNGVLQPSVFLVKTWNGKKDSAAVIPLAKYDGMASVLSGYMKEQSAKVAAATGLEVHGKTGSPERDKYVREGKRLVKKRVTDAWYTFFVNSPKLKAPVAFTIRIEEVGNSDHAKELAVEMLNSLKAAGYF